MSQYFFVFYRGWMLIFDNLGCFHNTNKYLLMQLFGKCSFFLYIFVCITYIYMDSFILWLKRIGKVGDWFKWLFTNPHFWILLLTLACLAVSIANLVISIKMGHSVKAKIDGVNTKVDNIKKTVDNIWEAITKKPW